MIIIASYSNVTVTYTADGTQTVFSFPFDYLRKAFVFVELNGETVLEQGTDYNVVDKTVVFQTAPVVDTVVKIYRQTDTTPLVSWADASVLRAKDMTIQQVQELHILEEYQYNNVIAVDTANEAKEIAEGIASTAEEALETADEAKEIAEGIEGKADTAIGTANTAIGIANNAQTIAEGIASTAEEALDSADAALDIVNALRGSVVEQNKLWDNTLLPAYQVWYPQGYNANSTILLNSQHKNLTNNEGATITVQDVVHYEDADPTPNENFTRTTGLYYTGTYEGYTANRSEAITQNFAGIQSVVKNNIGGIAGVSAVQGRLYSPDANPNANVIQYGGNKGIAVGGGSFNTLPCSYGGYMYGAEIDMYDNYSGGTFPTYQPNIDIWSDSAMPRPTAALMLSVGGNTQPVGAVMCMNGANNTGAWNGIFMGGSAFKMNGQNGYPGTVGINFGGWRQNGNYGHTAIRLGYAVRHLYARDGFKIASNYTYLIPKTNNDSAVFNLVSTTGNSSSIGFGRNVNVETDENMSNYTQEADIGYLANSDYLRIRSIRNIAFYTSSGAFDSTYGYVMSPSLFRPTTDNHATLGSADKRWNTLFAQNIQGTNNVNITATNGNSQTSTLALGSDGSLKVDNNNVALAKDFLPLTGGIITGNGTLVRKQSQLDPESTTGTEGFIISNRDKNDGSTGGLLVSASNSTINNSIRTINPVLSAQGINNWADFRLRVNGDKKYWLELASHSNLTLDITDNSYRIPTTKWTHDHYLPFTGGTLSGYLQFSASEGRIQSNRSNYDGFISIYGGGGYSTGAYLQVYGKNHATYPGYFRLFAKDDTNGTKELQGKPDGTLTWAGDAVWTSKTGTQTTPTLNTTKVLSTTELTYQQVGKLVYVNVTALRMSASATSTYNGIAVASNLPKPAFAQRFSPLQTSDESAQPLPSIGTDGTMYVVTRGTSIANKVLYGGFVYIAQ